jgi:hypothetical protein
MFDHRKNRLAPRHGTSGVELTDCRLRQFEYGFDEGWRVRLETDSTAQDDEPATDEDEALVDGERRERGRIRKHLLAESIDQKPCGKGFEEGERKRTRQPIFRCVKRGFKGRERRKRA